MRELFAGGLGIHHAGLLRSDRGLAERLFSEGVLNILVCTATLAWGVNLPAHTVIIKGTQLYNAEKGAFVDVGVLDVQQIFGRAGRPQFDTSGEGIILTQHAKLGHYLGMLTQSVPIESQARPSGRTRAVPASFPLPPLLLPPLLLPPPPRAPFSAGALSRCSPGASNLEVVGGSPSHD